MSSAEGELVYVVPRAVLPGDSAWRGVRPIDDPAGLLATIAAAGRFEPRKDMEEDPSHKQIIPYLVLRDGDRLFLMRRTRAGGDARLHDLYSIGVGGHINPGDEDVHGGLRREWHEELEADFVPDFDLLGLLNDDESPVGSVHLGVVFVGDASGRPGAVRETDKLSGSFQSVERVREVHDRMETWSQLVLEALQARDSAIKASGERRAADPPAMEPRTESRGVAS
jgi:predicted NUDIX family phosphoesterase